MMVNYHLLNTGPNKFKQKKTMCATWDELGESESEEDSEKEEAKLCFMAVEVTEQEENESEIEEKYPYMMIFVLALRIDTTKWRKHLKKNIIVKNDNAPVQSAN